MALSLFSKKQLCILGMNSGTSADGVDIAVISFALNGEKNRIKCIGGAKTAYPRDIKMVLEKIISDEYKSLDEVGRADIAYGTYLGRLAKQYISKSKYEVDLIASHGQTIGHFPEKGKIFGQMTGATVQIGDGNALACESGLPVVSDFRLTDIACGGEGAPVTPFINHLLFGDKKKSRIIVNIGGIANYSYHPAGGDWAAVRGGDCGPGNVLSDLVCRLLFHVPYDRDGKLAGSGRIIEAAQAPILDANRRRRISAGREQFDHRLLARVVHAVRRAKGSNEDVIATVADATAWLIFQSISKYVKDRRVAGIYLTGGGRRNIFLVRQLAERLKPTRLWPIEALGYDGDLLEAVSFAVLGGCFVRGLPSTLPHVTGARSGGIAGKLALPMAG